MLQDSHSRGISYTAGFFMLIVFVIAGVIFASLLSAPLWVNMTGKPLEALGNPPFDPADSSAYKLVQFISQVLGYFIPTLVTATMLSNRPLRLLGYEPGFKPDAAALVFFIMLLALLVSGGLSYINHWIPVPGDWKLTFQQWESEYLQQVEAIISLRSGLDFLLALLIMAVVPAICEETLFRGGFQNFLSRATGKPVLSIVIVSLIFSAFHFSFFGFLSRFFLGMVLGFLYHYSGKMWPSILAHFLNNAIALTAVYIYTQQGKPVSETLRETEAGWWGLLALPLVIALLGFFRKKVAPAIPGGNPES